MSDDERRQRQMDFILEGQAQFTEHMQQADRRMDRLERVVKLIIHAGRRERREWRERYNALVDSQMRTEAATRQIDQEWHGRYNALIDSQMRTEELTRRNGEDIGRLEKMVERIATNRNGNGTGGTDSA